MHSPEQHTRQRGGCTAHHLNVRAHHARPVCICSSMWRPTGASMARPRSLAGITSLVTGGDGMPPNSSALASPSPTIAALQVAAGPPAATLAPAGTGESSPLYSGAKVQDASLLKLLRGHCLRIRHRLRSAASGGVNGSPGLYSVALLLLLALLARYCVLFTSDSADE